MPEPDRMVGLDELFEVAPTPHEKPKAPEFSAMWWVRKGFIAIGLSVAIFLVLYVVRVGVPFPLILVTVLAILVLRDSLGQLADEPLPTEVTGAGMAQTVPDELSGPLEGLRYSVAATDGVRFAVGRWEDRLLWGDRDGARFATMVVPRLVELVDERLRQRHGITCASDPVRARRLLGDEVWQFLHSPPSRAANPQHVASIVAKVEDL
jgi:hypothetical protein